VRKIIYLQCTEFSLETFLSNVWSYPILLGVDAEMPSPFSKSQSCFCCSPN